MARPADHGYGPGRTVNQNDHIINLTWTFQSVAISNNVTVKRG